MNRGSGEAPAQVTPSGIPSTGGLAVYSPILEARMWFDGSADYFDTVHNTDWWLCFDLTYLTILLNDGIDVDKCHISSYWTIENQVHTVPDVVPVYLYDGPVAAFDTTTFVGTASLPGDPSGDSWIIKDVGNNASVNNIIVQVVTFYGSTSTGVANGTTTFVDATAFFFANGVSPNMWLTIAAGPAAGTYQIANVGSNTILTLTTPIPAASGISYTIAWGIDFAASITMNTDGECHNLTFFPGYGYYSL